MQLATRLLSATSLTLAEIAERVGYGSETALSRAYSAGLASRRENGSDDGKAPVCLSAPRSRNVRLLQPSLPTEAGIDSSSAVDSKCHAPRGPWFPDPAPSTSRTFRNKAPRVRGF
jgi:hypothetical protein